MHQILNLQKKREGKFIATQIILFGRKQEKRERLGDDTKTIYK